MKINEIDKEELQGMINTIFYIAHTINQDQIFGERKNQANRELVTTWVTEQLNRFFDIYTVPMGSCHGFITDKAQYDKYWKNKKKVSELVDENKSKPLKEEVKEKNKTNKKNKKSTGNTNYISLIKSIKEFRKAKDNPGDSISFHLYVRKFNEHLGPTNFGDPELLVLDEEDINYFFSKYYNQLKVEYTEKLKKLDDEYNIIF